MSRGNHGDKEFCKITGIKSSAHPGLTGNGACRVFFGDLHKFRTEILCRLLFEGEIVRKTGRLMEVAMDLEE